MKSDYINELVARYRNFYEEVLRTEKIPTTIVNFPTRILFHVAYI